MDVESLYTNIDTTVAMKVVQSPVEKNPELKFNFLQIKEQQWAKDSHQPTLTFTW